ncbi:MAG TPA: response regulator transcription factor [Bacteroidota bacterium]|nr:response regulator transcription factor [Bacteroidota bacterium]
MAKIRSQRTLRPQRRSASGRSPIRILVADDQAIVRSGIALLLKSIPGFDVVGEAENGLQAVELSCTLEPDIVLMNLTLVRLNGIQAASLIKSSLKSVRIILLAVHDGQHLVMKTIESGADGYLLKNSTPGELTDAVRAVAGGKAGFYCPTIPPETIEMLRYKIDHTVRNRTDLTPREKEVLQLVAEGHSHQDIARMLDLSIRTIDAHRNNLMQKLELHDGVALVRYAMKEGLIGFEP